MNQNLYEELLKQKNEGKKLDWNSITKEELENLFEEHSDSIIAELYDITKSQVTNKRKKLNIKQYNYIFKNFLKDNANNILFNDLNQNSKERLLDEKNIDIISIALTRYLFRNGPVEDMHRDGKLSQNDMKTLNKFMVNRFAGLLQTVDKGEWIKLELLLNYYNKYSR